MYITHWNTPMIPTHGSVQDSSKKKKKKKVPKIIIQFGTLRFKGAFCSFEADILIRREITCFDWITMLFLWRNKLNKQTVSMTEETKRTPKFLTVLLGSYVADPASFLASSSDLGTFFCSENSLFLQVMMEISIKVIVVTSQIWISSPKLHSAPLMYIL